nr:fimbrial protein [Enterobacter soli]
MKFNSTFIALSVSALLFSGMANAAITGTSSAEMTFVSTVTSGTCTTVTTDGAGASTSEIKFGTVYKSDLVKKSRVEPMSIIFSNCSGVTKAQVTAVPGAIYGCSGPNGDGDSYGAKYSTGFEVWSGAVDSGVLLSCNKTAAPQDVTISGGVGEFPVNTRIVIGKDYTAADLGAGVITSQVSFVITYP